MSLAVFAGRAGVAKTQPASVEEMLAGWSGADGLWVFAYGSLIWHPGFAWRERRLATVRG